MGINRGKKFEEVVRQAFEGVPDISIDRLHDQMTGYKGSQNICDFIVYRYPNQYYFECKSVYGNTLSIHSNPKPDKNGVLHGFYGNITDKQWEGLLEKSKIPGVTAGIICWWIDKDVTKFIRIEELNHLYQNNWKSIRFDHTEQLMWTCYDIPGKKKRVFFDYDMEGFLNEI